MTSLSNIERRDQSDFFQSAESMRFAINAAGIGIWEVDVHTNTVIWDDRCRELFGLPTNSSLPYAEAIQHIHKDDVDEVNNRVQAALRGDQNGIYDITYRTIGATDGLLRWVNFNGKAYFDQEGKVTAFGGVARDVTLQATAQQKLEQSQTALLAAIEVANLGTFNVDINAGIINVSPQTARWFGFNSLTASVEAFIAGVGREEQEYVRNSLEKAIQPDSDGRYDVVHSIINAKTGQKTIIHALSQVHLDDSGRPVYVNGIAVDITIYHDMQTALEAQVRKRTEELDETIAKLTESNELLLRSNEELAQYAHVASHDLQEPLRKIITYASLLSTDSRLPQELLPTFDKIQTNASRMIALIKDLLQFSKLLKSDSLFENTDLNDILKLVISDYDLLISERKAVITINSLPTIAAVPFQMQQLFSNLIGNALKFAKLNESPKISISCQKESTDTTTTGCAYHIIVKDQGIGFSQDYALQIFEVFSRLHTRHAFPGTGIGLALCKRITLNHSGQIFAVSEEGKGAEFHVLLPCQQIE